MKTVHDLPSNWKEQMLALYKAGASDTEVRSELNITIRLWNTLKLTDPSFEEVVTQGKTYAKAWWMTQGRSNLENKNFNAVLYKIMMQNMFNWNEKTANVDESDEDVMDDEESINKQLEELQTSERPN